MTQKYRAFPTLIGGVYIDIQANSEEEAIAKVDELAKAIIDERAAKLAALGFLEGAYDNCIEDREDAE